MDWDKLRIFHAAAQAGSFTHAGEVLGLSQSAVSRQVSALEKDLSATLFHRHARGLALTEQGETLYATVSEVIGKLETTKTLLSDARLKPTGQLRISAPVALGTEWVTQCMNEFLGLYPDINVELLLNDEQVDLAKREADVGIWLREPADADLIRKPLFSLRLHAFASMAYVRRHGAPQSLDELDRHKIVSYSGAPAQHLTSITYLDTVGKEAGDARLPVFKVNSVLAMKNAIVAGIGIGILPEYQAEGESGLMPVLDEVQPPSIPILFVYPEELKASKKVQVLRDFLVAAGRRWKY